MAASAAADRCKINGASADPVICKAYFRLMSLRLLSKPMKRREFIRLFGSTAVAWPRIARAQQSAIPVIGFLNSTSPQQFANYVADFRATSS